MEIYHLQTYQYSSYSYDGLAPSESYFFTTEEKARAFAKANNWTIVEYGDNDNQATLEKVIVR